MKLKFKEWFSSLLTEDFKSQRAKFIATGVNEFEVDFYFNWFKVIKQTNPKGLQIDPMTELPSQDRNSIDNYKNFNQLKSVIDKVFQNLGKHSFENMSYVMAKKRFVSQGKNKAIVDQLVNIFKSSVDQNDPKFNTAMTTVSMPAQLIKDINAYEKFADFEKVTDILKAGQNTDTEEDVTGAHKIYPPQGTDSPIEIYYGPNEKACIQIKGSHPTSWCVSRPVGQGNLYTNYRFGKGTPAFYFVKNKEKLQKEIQKGIKHFDYIDPYHFFSIQVIKDPEDTSHEKPYVVTNALNDMDRPMDWEDIVKIEPNLRQLKDLFKPVEYTDKELQQKMIEGKEFTDAEFAALSFEDKKLFIDLVGEKINLNKFNSLGDILQKDFLSRNNININDNLLRWISMRPEYLKYLLKSNNLIVAPKLINFAIMNTNAASAGFDNEFASIYNQGSTSDKERMATTVAKALEKELGQKKKIDGTTKRQAKYLSGPVVDTIIKRIVKFLKAQGQGSKFVVYEIKTSTNPTLTAKTYDQNLVKKEFAYLKNAVISEKWLKTVKNQFSASIFNIIKFFNEYDLLPDDPANRAALSKLVYEKSGLRKHMLSLGSENIPDISYIADMLKLNPKNTSTTVLNNIYLLLRKSNNVQDAKTICNEISIYPEIVNKLALLTDEKFINSIPELKAADEIKGFLRGEIDPKIFKGSNLIEYKEELLRNNYLSRKRNEWVGGLPYPILKILVKKIIELKTNLTDNFKQSLSKIFGPIRVSLATIRDLKQPMAGRAPRNMKQLFYYNKEAFLSPKIIYDLTEDEINDILTNPQARSKLIFSGELYQDLSKDTRKNIINAFDSGRIKFVSLPSEDTWENFDKKFFKKMQKQFMIKYAKNRLKD